MFLHYGITYVVSQLNKLTSTAWDYCLGKSSFMSSTTNIGCFKSPPPPIRCLNRNELVINKIATIYKTQKIIQLKDIYNVEVRKFMYTNAKSWLPATFINYFKLITDVYSYNTKQVKTRQFALPKARSKSGAKMIKLSAVEIWSKMPLEIKNKQCLALFSEEYKKTCITQLPEALFVFFLLVYIKHVH